VLDNCTVLWSQVYMVAGTVKEPDPLKIQ